MKTLVTCLAWLTTLARLALSTQLQAVSFTSYQLGSVLASEPTDAGAYIDRRIFAQAVNPASSGFVVENSGSVSVSE